MKMPTIKTKSSVQSIKNSKLDHLISFIDCCNTNIGKQTFYNKEDTQMKSMFETHDKALNASRVFYALMLLPNSTTDANKIVAIYNLLHNPRIPYQQKIWENALIKQTFSIMQPNRIFDALNYLVSNRVNNFRTRKLIADFLKDNQRSLALWALKYKKPFKRIIRHAHISSRTYEEVAFLLLKKTEDSKFSNKLLSDYIKAKYGDTDALYKLPFTIARGFASKYKIEEKKFLTRYAEEGKISQKEKRQQQQELKKKGIHVAVDASKLNLFDLFVYLGALNENKALFKDAHKLIKNAAKKIADATPYNFDNACVILDTSLSMSGEKETKNHPLYRSLAVSAVIKELSDKFAEYRTHDTNSLIPRLTAQTDYSSALLKALKAEHNYVFILGDGYENTPYEGAVNQLLTAYKKRIDKNDETKVIHFNPVFASETKGVRNLFAEDKYAGVAIRDAYSLAPAMFLAMSRQDKYLALKAYFSCLLKLQNRETKQLQPTETQLLLE